MDFIYSRLESVVLLWWSCQILNVNYSNFVRNFSPLNPLWLIGSSVLFISFLNNGKTVKKFSELREPGCFHIYYWINLTFCNLSISQKTTSVVSAEAGDDPNVHSSKSSSDKQPICVKGGECKASTTPLKACELTSPPCPTRRGFPKWTPWS